MKPLLGYRRVKSSHWHKDFPDLIHIFGVQKSSWGGENYLEAGIWLKTFGPDELPNLNECHVRLRIDAACGIKVDELRAALYEDDLWKMDADERFTVITAALKQTEDVFFSRTRSVEQLKAFLTSNHKPVVLVQKRAKELLGTLPKRKKEE